MKRRLSCVLAADMVGFSRMMETDTEDLIARQTAHRKGLIDPAIAAHDGRIIKTTGDGLLVEFPSAAAAVVCARDVQMAMCGREAAEPSDRRIQYRIGITIGDVIDQDGDIFGDCVNIAARLEGLAEPGGVAVSDPVVRMLDPGLTRDFADLGLQRVKNISRPIRIWHWSASTTPSDTPHEDTARQQKVGFCTAPDGVQLAYAVTGTGPPLFKAPNWMNHVDHDWRSPIFAPCFAQISQHNTLLRFDQRGNGLSDWEVDEISAARMQDDMETVIDAAGFDRFALLGQSQGGAFAVEYAAAHPERVTCIVVLGGYLRGPLAANEPGHAAMHNALTEMVRHGWGQNNPAFRSVFVEGFLPSATKAQKDSFDTLQRMATSAENAERILNMNASLDITEAARRIRVPTLVLHAEGDRRIPVSEGRKLAAMIPNADFITLPGDNHILTEGTAAFDMYLRLLRDFVAAHSPAQG